MTAPLTSIVGLSPEQIIDIRARFVAAWIALYEAHLTPDSYGYEERMAEIFKLEVDGFSYCSREVNESWDWYLSGSAEALKSMKPKESDSMQSLMLMRQYSSCFTKAFDKKEPVFVLRAQDLSASAALGQWIVTNKIPMGESNPKWIAAKATLGAFQNWPNRKQPD